MPACAAAADRVPDRSSATDGSTGPAGTLAQLAGQGARLVASPRRRVFPGRPDQVGQARRFVARALEGVPGRRRRGALRLRAGQHRDPAHPLRSGGPVQVLVWRGRASACVAVIDDGARQGPAARMPVPDDLAESGHGLRVVAELAVAWGHQDLRPVGLPGRAVWFHLAWLPGSL